MWLLKPILCRCWRYLQNRHFEGDCVCWTLLANDHVEFLIIIFPLKSVLQPPHLWHSQMRGSRKWFSGMAGNTSIIVVSFLLLGLDVLKKRRCKTLPWVVAQTLRMKMWFRCLTSSSSSSSSAARFVPPSISSSSSSSSSSSPAGWRLMSWLNAVVRNLLLGKKKNCISYLLHHLPHPPHPPPHPLHRLPRARHSHRSPGRRQESWSDCEAVRRTVVRRTAECYLSVGGGVFAVLLLLHQLLLLQVLRKTNTKADEGWWPS